MKNERKNNNITEHLHSQQKWEQHAKKGNKNCLKKALKYLAKTPPLVGMGPSVRVLLDLSNSTLAAMQGDFKSALGHNYKQSMQLEELVPYILPEHNAFIAKNFPVYLKYIISMEPDKRDLIDFSVSYKFYKKGDYHWMTQRVFKNFNDDNGILNFVLMEYSDISEVKKNEVAQFVVFNRESKEYIINNTFNPHDSTHRELTSSELEITKLVRHGLSDLEIAKSRSISFQTVKQHKKNIYKKLDINKSTQLVNWAFEHGVAG
ncbi:MAG: LuxR C-terminal-related transcriptional regulator [Cyclobacteriaceae bacterium]|nr:LuxR C-terminal-related transcriptional regulator [Cyclobacteriaceae bacterium]